MKNLGSHHPHLALPLVPELLCLHPYFDTPEPDMDDAACILLVQKTNKIVWVGSKIFACKPTCCWETFKLTNFIKKRSLKIFWSIFIIKITITKVIGGMVRLYFFVNFIDPPKQADFSVL